MKPSLALLISLFAATVSSEARPTPDSRRDSAPFDRMSAHHITIAQADGKGDEEKSHQQTLESMLERDDFAAAKDFVDRLAEAGDVPPAALRSLNDRIRRARTTRLLDYAEKIRQAIIISDLDAVKEYNERMRQLTAVEPTTKPRSSDDAAAISPKEDPDQTLDARSDRPVANGETSAPERPAPTTEDPKAVTAMRAALDEGRLFPPAVDNAFDLATARLATKPGDTEALSVLEEAIGKQQADVLAKLKAGRPETALEASNQMLAAIVPLGAEAGISSDDRASTLQWIEQTKPDIVAGLVANTEKAIEGLNLAIAPKGKLSAESYAGLLAEELGKDHEAVKRLAGKIIETYRALIDRQLARHRYERAAVLHARMDVIAQRFGVSVDEVAELGRYIEALPARQARHDQLLEQAAQWRHEGRLIEPKDTNALEAAASAIRLAVDPEAAEAAGKVFDEVILEQRQKINGLINDDRLQQAARQLKQLGAAIERTGNDRYDRAAAYYAEADRLLGRSELEEKQQRMEAKKAEAAALPPEPKPSPFTFVNPF